MENTGTNWLATLIDMSFIDMFVLLFKIIGSIALIMFGIWTIWTIVLFVVTMIVKTKFDL